MTVIEGFVWDFYLALSEIDTLLGFYFWHFFFQQFSVMFLCPPYCLSVTVTSQDCAASNGEFKYFLKGSLVSGSNQASISIHHQPILPRHQSTRDAKVISNGAKRGESRVFPSHIIQFHEFCFLVAFCLQEAERFRHCILKRLKETKNCANGLTQSFLKVLFLVLSKRGV